MASSLSMVFDLLAVDRASAVFQKVGDSAGEAGAKVDAAAATTSNAGSKIAAGLGIAAGAAAVYSVKMAADFQTNVTKLATTAGEAQGNLKLVSDGMLSMAGQVGVGAVELAKGMYTIESSGIHGADALTALKAAAQGAKQENADLSHVADALSTVLHDYNLPASAAADTTSKLVEAVAHGKTTFDELTASLHSVTPLAAALHVPLQDILGSLSAMTASGMSADQATQNMADALRHLQAPTAGMTSELAQLGINSADLSAQLGTKGLSGVMQEISDAIIQHLNPATQKVLLPALNQSKTAAQDMQAMIGQMPKTLADLSTGLLNGQTSLGDYRKQVQGMGGDAGAMGLQFLSLYKSADGFNQLLKSGSPAAQEYSAALYKAVGDSSSLSVALQLTGEHAATTNKAISDIAKASGDAKGNIKGWDEVQGNFNQQLAESGAKLQAMAIQLGQALLPALTTSVHFINSDVLPGIEHLGSAAGDAAHWFSELPGPVKDVALALAALRIADMIGVFDKLSGSVGGLRASFQGFREAVQLQQALQQMEQASGNTEAAFGRLGATGTVAMSKLKAGVSSVKDAFGGGFGLAIAGVVGVVALYQQGIQKAADTQNKWTEALKQGGYAADDARAAMQKTAAQEKELNNGFAGFAATVGGVSSNIKQMTPNVDAATKAYNSWYNSLSPVDKATQDVTQAQAKLSEVIQQYGPASGAAKIAAAQYQDALAHQKTTQDQLNQSEQTHLEKLQAVASQQLASVSSALAAQQAQMQLKDALDQYNKDASDGQHSTAQLAQEQNNLAQQVIGAAQAAGQAAADQAKANGVTDTAQASNAAMLKSLQDNEKFLTGPAKDAIDQQIKILQGATIQTGNLSDAVDKMGLKTVTTYSANTQIVEKATDDQIQKLRDLGLVVTTLPNGHILVDANTDPARLQMDNLVAHLGSLFGSFASNFSFAFGKKATGGPIVGPGTGTSDTAGLYALSNGEHVWTAAEVQAAGGHTAVESMRQTVISQGRGLAAGGRVGGYALGSTWTDYIHGVISAKIDSSLSGLTPQSLLGATVGSAPGNPTGNAALGKVLAGYQGWGSGAEWNALYALWQRESGWNNNAQNPTSTAYGIPQFLNSTWASLGIAKSGDAATQINAGLKYIAQRFGDPIGAWGHETRFGWYKDGTNYVPSDQLAYLHKGEAVVPASKNQGAPFQGGGPVTLQLDAGATTALLQGQAVQVVVGALGSVRNRLNYNS